MRIWLGDEMMLEMPVVLGLCAYFYILKSGDIRWVYHEGAGLWYESRFIMIGEAAGNIVLNILLCKTMGIFGIVLATVISVFITNMLFCPELLFRLYFKNGKLTEYWRDHAAYACTMLITAGISWLVCEKSMTVAMAENGIMTGVLCLGGRLLVCTVLSAVIFWIIWHRNERYNKAIRWMKKMVEN